MWMWETTDRLLGKRTRKLFVFVLIFAMLFSSFGTAIFYLFEPEEVAAAEGDFAIYRENGGADVIGNLTPIDQDYDRIVSQGSGFSLDTGAGSTTVTLSDAGHYLAMYNIGLETNGGTNRSMIDGYIDLNGVDQPYGRASCYIRRADGANECWISGAAIIEATTTNQTIKIESIRTDTNGATVRRRGQESGLSLLKLDELWDFARFQSTSTVTLNNSSFTTFAWTNSDEIDTDTFSRSGGDITLTEQGHYLVTVNVTMDAGARRIRDMRLTLDGFELPGSRTTAYLRGTTNTRKMAAVYMGIIEATTTNQVLRVETACALGESCSGVTHVAGESGMTIAKLPDSAEYIRLYEEGGSQAVDGSSDPILWDTQDEIDNSYTHSTTSNSSRINIQEDGDYLFFGAFQADGSAGNNIRQYPHWEWAVGGTEQSYGSFGRFKRGNGDNSTGDSGGIILPNLTAGQYVELWNTDEGDDTDALGVFQADRYAVQGVRIDTLIVADVTVDSIGSQISSTTIPIQDEYIGGSFTMMPNRGNETLTGITITEQGTVDAQNDLDQIRLYYDLDTSAPYDCASEAYSGLGTEAQFGATSSNFSAANGTSAFTDSVAISTTSPMCVYVVLDVASTTSNGETLEIQITDPSSDVTLSSGDVDPESAVLLSDTTTLKDDVLVQVHTHWRNDDGTELLATSITGDEDISFDTANKTTTYRLRLEVSNEGLASSSPQGLRLEYAQRMNSCASSTGWTDVGASGGDWDMSATLNLIDGFDTTNIATSTGGVTDEEATFVSSNGGQRDTNSQIASTTIDADEFIEVEYAIEATAGAPDGTTYCFRLSNAGVPLFQYDEYAEATLVADVLVSATGTQVATVNAGDDYNYIGGVFAIQDQAGSRNVTDITVTETGTVDAATYLNDIHIHYEFDTTAPYDCASVSYDGDELQFGATSSSFSSANGSSTFSGSVGITNTSSMCVYTVLDVANTSPNGATIELEIYDSTSDVLLSAGSIGPDTPVGIDGSTSISGAVLDQIHYHWRNDDGTETSATSKTAGNEDTAISNVVQNEAIRLRLEVSNEGLATSMTIPYRLEYATLSGTCASSSGWTDVGATGGDWDMSDSANLTDGDDTTNIPESDGGVTNENTTFETPNSGVKDTSSQTAGIQLTTSEYVELEYSIEATNDASFSTTYCFRLTNAGTVLDQYSVYPTATTRANQDFFIQRGVTTIGAGSTTATLIAGTHYSTPASSERAFIRITNTNHTGAGRDSAGGNQNADDVTTYIRDPGNIENSINFERFGSADNTRIAWEIVEYIGPAGGGNEIRVRRADHIDFGTGELATSTTIAGVTDANDVVSFVTGAANPDVARTDYNTSLVTAGHSTTSVTFTRGEAGSDAIAVSFAVVEFIGEHWRIQRIEHNYGGAGSDENVGLPITVDDSKTFLHVQKRVNANQGMDEYGQTVYISGSGSRVTFRLEGGATTPNNHDAVAWVIENLQTTGDVTEVYRSNFTQSGGSEPATVNYNIGTAISSLDNASIFMVNRVTGTGTNYPRPIISTRLISTSQYEVWVSDTGQTRNFRTEVVEWPTASREIVQNFYQFYVDNDALDPTDEWPAGAGNIGENAAITVNDDPLGVTERVRIRMSLSVSDGAISVGAKQFKLQYGQRDTVCSAISSWNDVGDSASTTIWRGYDATPADNTVLSGNPPTGGDLNLSVSDRAGSYEEESPTLANQYKINIGEDIEYDWILEQNSAPEGTTYCFRMVESDNSLLTDYTYYPTLLTAGFSIYTFDWRWYDDETSTTPTIPLAGTNTAPANISTGNVLKLRMIVEETAGSDGLAKFKVQYSEQSDFSSGVNDVVDSDQCTDDSRWCYYNGAGSEHATITERVIYTADACSGGLGAGCGTHNEYSYVPEVIGEVGTGSTDNGGTTINLSHSYTDPVFIVEATLGDSAGPGANDPAVAIITGTTSNSFTVRIQEPDNEADDHGVEDFSYIVMESGAHTLDDGTRIDAGRITTSDYYGNAVGGTSDDTCTFTQTFTGAPVVLTALQSDYNTSAPDFLTASQLSVTASQFSCAIEVPDGETNAPSNSEILGWIAIEPGTMTNNTRLFEIATTSQSVQGWTDTWHTNSFTANFFPSVAGVVASKQTRGADGGWVRYDTIGTSSVQLAIDERDDGERSHTTSETVGYLAFSSAGTIFGVDTATSTLQANSAAEYEFTIEHHDALVATTYFFRLYDVVRDVVVTASSTETYPSLVTESGSLTFTITGLESGTTTEGIVTDATTTATSVPFGILAAGVENEAAHRLSVTTNTTEGYQIFLHEDQNLLSGSSEIAGVNASNTTPLAWSSACTIPTVTGCWGYHSGDNTLSGGSTRFLANDTYAEISQTLEEVAYSSGPVVNDENDIVYKLQVTTDQPAGQYQSNINYVVVPTF